MTTYVYAITRASHPLSVNGQTGIGETPAPLRTVRTNDLAAVVSDAPPDLRAKRRDLEAHEAVMDVLISQGPVLPMRFGMVASDDAVVERELTSHAGPYTDMLTELEGKFEVNVKASHHEDAVLAQILDQHPDLRQMNDQLRESGGGTVEDKMAFGERVSTALEERRTADADQLLAILRPFAERERLGPPVESAFVNASFLITDDSRAEFESTVTRLRQEIGQLIELNVYGPLPPYSFVDVAPGQDQTG